MAHMEALTVRPKVVCSPVRIKPGKRVALRQVLQLQQRLFEESGKAGVKPSDLAQLARAWDILEERKRILKGRPLPGSLKPATLKTPKRKYWVNLEPLDSPEDGETEGAGVESQPTA
jgi:hypothetical protein